MSTAAPTFRPRFSWPMRIFLFVLLFDIIFRSLSVLVPWDDWGSELDMDLLPRRLPTAAECRQLADEASPENPDPVAERVHVAMKSLRDYWKPWPQEETREIMEDVDNDWEYAGVDYDWEDAGMVAQFTSIRRQLLADADWEYAGNVAKFTLVWFSSRLDFVENLIGFNQEWPMFSPNVGKHKKLTRARLAYADGDQKVVRNHADPPNLLSYSHWNQEKVLDFELRVRNSAGHAEECFGYCNLLAHRHAHNANGAALVTIRLYEVEYDYAPPGVDYEAFYREQMARTAERWPAQDNPARPREDRPVYADYYEFEASLLKGRRLDN